MEEHDELEYLHELEWIASIASSAGWKKLKDQWAIWLENAQNTIDGNLSSDRELVYRLNLRRQVLKGFIRDSIAYVESAKEKQQQILEPTFDGFPIPQRIGDEFSGEEEYEHNATA